MQPVYILRRIESENANAGDHWKIRGGIWHYSYVATSYQFGCRIHSNEEVLVMREHIAKLTAERDAAEAELEAATHRILDQEVA